jgi:hypothetical protein
MNVTNIKKLGYFNLRLFLFIGRFPYSDNFGKVLINEKLPMTLEGKNKDLR